MVPSAADYSSAIQNVAFAQRSLAKNVVFEQHFNSFSLLTPLKFSVAELSQAVPSHSPSRRLEPKRRPSDRYKGKSAQQDRKINAAQELITKGPIAPTAFPYTIDLGPGPTVQSLDKADSFHIGGRIYVDGGGSTQPERGLSEIANLTQARLQVEGRLRSIWEYKVQYDFVGGSNATTVGAAGGIRDAYLALIYPGFKPPFLPNPIEVQIGNFYLPHGLERSESKNYIDFVERSLMSDTFGASRHVGLALLTHGSNWTFKTAVSSTSLEDASLKPASETAMPFGVGNQANWVSTGGRQYWDITARATYAPIWSEDKLLHFGASGRYHRPNDATGANDDRVTLLGSNTYSEGNVLKENLLGTPDLSCSGLPTGLLGPTADPNGVISSTLAGYIPNFASQISPTAVAGHCLKSVLTFGAELSAAYDPLAFQAEYMTRSIIATRTRSCPRTMSPRSPTTPGRPPPRASCPILSRRAARRCSLAAITSPPCGS